MPISACPRIFCSDTFNEAPAGGRGMRVVAVSVVCISAAFNEAPAGGRGMQRGLEAMIGAACAGRLRGLRKTAAQL